MKKSEDEKTSFLFQNAVIGNFISYKSLILGNSKYIYKLLEKFSIFFSVLG